MGIQLVTAGPVLVVKTMAATNSTTNQRCPATDDSADAETVLGVLNDTACRAILEATTEDTLTATELSEQCAIPMSTAYRKVEELAGAGLLEERVRINTSAKHATEYRRCFDEVLVSVDGGDLEIEMTNDDTENETGRASHSPIGKTEAESDSSFPYAVADD
ncbi:hypothetical protein JCM18750_39150 [Halostagnicola bangensis]